MTHLNIAPVRGERKSEERRSGQLNREHALSLDVHCPPVLAMPCPSSRQHPGTQGSQSPPARPAQDRLGRPSQHPCMLVERTWNDAPTRLLVVAAYHVVVHLRGGANGCSSPLFAIPQALSQTARR